MLCLKIAVAALKLRDVAKVQCSVAAMPADCS